MELRSSDNLDEASARRCPRGAVNVIVGVIKPEFHGTSFRARMLARNWSRGIPALRTASCDNVGTPSPWCYTLRLNFTATVSS